MIAQLAEPLGFGLPPLLSGTTQVAVLEPAVSSSTIPLPPASWLSIPGFVLAGILGFWGRQSRANWRLTRVRV